MEISSIFSLFVDLTVCFCVLGLQSENAKLKFANQDLYG